MMGLNWLFVWVDSSYDGVNPALLVGWVDSSYYGITWLCDGGF